MAGVENSKKTIIKYYEIKTTFAYYFTIQYNLKWTPNKKAP